MCWSLPKAVCFIRRLYSSPSFNRQPPAKGVYNVLEAGVYRGLARYAWLRMVRNQECEYLGFVHGQRRWRSRSGKRLLTWDSLHGEIEVSDLLGRHVGVLSADGQWRKGPITGRSIDV